MDTNDRDDEQRRQMLLDSIPKLEDFEGRKENIISRRQGRSAAALTALFQAEDKEIQAELQQGHEYFRDELAHIDDLDDPLDVYIRYVNWTENMHPQGHNQDSNLIGLLRELTEQFQNDARYKNDPRYLQCWIKYAEWVEDAKQIFLFLIKNDIGQQLALFYEEYATFCERRENYKEAEEIFAKGIAREAEPKNRLKRRQEQFLARMQHRKATGQPLEPPNPARAQIQALERTGRRTMLGHKMGSSSPFSVPANVYRNIEGSTQTQAQQGREAPFGNASSSRPLRTNAFSVYTESSEPSISSSIPPKRLPTMPSSSSSTSAIISRASHSQENQVVSSRFAGTTLPQKISHRPTAPSFQVYRDDGAQEGGDAVVDEECLLQFSSEPHDAARLRKNPLLDLTASSQRRPYLRRERDTELPELQDRFETRKHSFILSTDSAGRTEYIAAVKDCIERNSCVSFEELRARHYASQRSRLEITIPQPPSEFTYTKVKLPHSPTEEITAETKAAMQSIGALFRRDTSNGMSLDEEQEEEQCWQYTPKPVHQRTYVNENDDAIMEGSSTRRKEEDRIPFMSLKQDSFLTGTDQDVDNVFDGEGDNDDDDDDDDMDDELERDMAREAAAAEARQAKTLPKKRAFDHVYRDQE